MSKRTRRARSAQSPTDTQLAALEIIHPDIAEPARIVNDQPGRVPAAQISIDNVGREIVKWIDRARATPSGIHGITVRVMIVTARGDAPVAAPDYDVRMDVLLIKASTRNVTIHLGFDPELGRPAVLMRHDPATSPGLF